MLTPRSDRLRGGARPGWVSIAWVFLLAVGCGSTDDDPAGSVCSDDSACGPSQVCRRGFCTVESTNDRYRVDLALFPPASASLYRPQIADDLRVGPNRKLDVALEPLVSVRSRIQVAGNPQPDCVPEQRVVFEPSRRPEHTLEARPISTPVSSEACSSTRRNAQCFRTSLAEGVYDIRFVPGSPGDNQCESPYPPVTWQNRRITRNVRPTFEVPNPDDLVTISGKLVYSPPGVGPDATRPLAGARVYAVGSDDETLKSTADVTRPLFGEQPGQFTIQILPSRRPVAYDLVVRPSSKNEFIPERRIRSAALERSSGTQGLRVTPSDAEDDGQITLQAFDVGAYPGGNPVEVNATFRTPVDFDDEVDWSSFRVVFETSGLEAGRILRTAGVRPSGEEGRVSTELMPVPHDGWILPPPRSHLRARTFEVDAGAQSDLDPISLKREPRLQGEVVRNDGTSVEGAEIAFRMIRPTGSTVSLERRLRGRLSTRVEVADDGTFSARLEPADYRVVVEPAPVSGLARRIARLRADTLRKGDGVRFQLPKPMLVEGHVYRRFFNPDGTVGAEALPEAAVQPRVTRFGLATPLGREYSREGGRFHAILPATSP